MNLTDDQKRRYARNILLPDIGLAGQQKLLAAKTLVIGAGGLGSPVITYLAAAGIGTIGILDHDRVELSNLQRQIIHETGDIGRAKTESARNRVEELNPDIEVVTHALRLDDNNVESLLTPYDIIADGTDNFATRFTIAAACHQFKKPLVSAAIRGFEGQLSTFKSHLGAPHPCYRCLVSAHPADAQTCADTGVLGSVAGVLGSMQATEIIKEILSIGESLSGRLLRYDALTQAWKTSTIRRNPNCSICA